MSPPESAQRLWWKEGTAYQIYPASFKDSNGDGLGDIPGIPSKVDYLKELGVDIVWVSPMFESPQVDMGYDISNYEAVYAPYGTLEDMQALIDACHERGMKLILDLVINHTSAEHAWFKESRSSKDNPKRDWYIWKPARYAADGTRLPPTNWRSYFSGGTWEWDAHTQEYYLHLFAKEMPDLNWENEETRKAIYDSSMRFWLDRGVDGFRVDCVNMYSKRAEFKDAPVVNADVYEQPGWSEYANGPRMHEFLREMNEQVLGRYDAMTVGELPHTPDPKHVLQYVGLGDRQLSMVFQFDIVDIGQGASDKYRFQSWRLPQLKQTVARWQQFVEGTDGWTTAFCENHDQGRSVSRFASDAPADRAHSAKLLALMLAAMSGTLFIYQGQEIGMINVPANWPIDEYRDIETVNFFRTASAAAEATLSGDPAALQAEIDYVRRSIQILGRDNARTPMEWDASSPAAGFTDRPAGGWMRVHDLYPEINVARQQQEPDSVLAFGKAVLRLRKQHADLFIYGDFRLFDPDTNDTFVFAKTATTTTAAAANLLNFSATDQTVDLPAVGGSLQFLMGNYADAVEVDEAQQAAQPLGRPRTLRPLGGPAVSRLIVRVYPVRQHVVAARHKTGDTTTYNGCLHATTR
ncbi:maltase [Grosmannia clavigera kw1407]|uniref:Alpha-glucosidase n=1 Tax=Grosmannia clavigera (strain kw1407 / UAMH 11150) TaxID=655863 RepID=F0XH23_GROCL|nr:maltase [Grosmannia clavigera kw1407]EFX02886.1 maltase [Grosmannia clavigera kw1407]